MSFKKTLVFTILLALVAVFIYFFEMPRTKQKAAKEEADKKILDMDFDAVDRVEIVRPEDSVLLEKVDDAWHIISPVKDLADSYQVTSVINAVRFGIVNQRLTDLKTPLENYGLADPKTKITLRAGGVTKTLEIGKKYQIGGALFIKQADTPEVLIVPDSLLAAISKTPSEIRESKVFRGEHGPVVRLKIEQENKTIDLVRVQKEFLKEGEEEQWEWKFNAPFDGYAQQQQIDDLVDKARNLVASDFVREDRNDDARFGLDRPALRITLGFAPPPAKGEGNDADEKEKPAEGTFEAILRIGNQKPNQDDSYAALDGAGFVITLSKESVAPFSADAESLKDRHLVRFDPDSVAKIRLQIADSSSSISHSGADWTFEDGAKADAKALDGIIEGIEKMQGTWVGEGKKVKPKKYGITNKSDSISLFDAQDRLLVRLLRGNSNQTLGSVQIADAAQEPMRIFTLAQEEIGFWPHLIEGLKAQDQAPSPEETANEDDAQ